VEMDDCSSDSVEEPGFWAESCKIEDPASLDSNGKFTHSSNFDMEEDQDDYVSKQKSPTSIASLKDTNGECMPSIYLEDPNGTSQIKVVSALSYKPPSLTSLYQWSANAKGENEGNPEQLFSEDRQDEFFIQFVPKNGVDLMPEDDRDLIDVISDSDDSKSTQQDIMPTHCIIAAESHNDVNNNDGRSLFVKGSNEPESDTINKNQSVPYSPTYGYIPHSATASEEQTMKGMDCTSHAAYWEQKSLENDDDINLLKRQSNCNQSKDPKQFVPKKNKLKSIVNSSKSFVHQLSKNNPKKSNSYEHALLDGDIDYPSDFIPGIQDVSDQIAGYTGKNRFQKLSYLTRKLTTKENRFR